MSASASAIHIIGDQDTVLGYRFAGATGSVVSTPEEAKTAFLKVTAAKQEGILLITEAVANMIPELVNEHKLQAKRPYIAIIEDIWGSREKRRSLEDLIFEAAGVRIATDE